MSTVADELLNDFGSSGDEAEENDNDGLVNDEPQENGDHDVMDVDGDQEGSDDEEGNDMKEMGDAEATKAKVEKMQLGAVKDVRSVASLMQTLEPVLEVSISPPIQDDVDCILLKDGSFTSSFLRHSPDILDRAL